MVIPIQAVVVVVMEIELLLIHLVLVVQE